MKFAKVGNNGRVAWGLVIDDAVRILGGWNAGASLGSAFDLPARSSSDLHRLAEDSDEVVALDEVSLLPPIAATSKLICLGLNYRAHLEEAQEASTQNPGLFTKMPDALVGHGAPVIRPKVSDHFDYEGEIAVVIGRGGRHIARADGLAHVFGYTIMLDGSVRDRAGLDTVVRAG